MYVQHRLKERSKEVAELLSKKAYFYVCGDAAHMAREVNAVLAEIIAESRGVSATKGEEIVKNMRAANQYQVRNITESPPETRNPLTTSAGGCLVVERIYKGTYGFRQIGWAFIQRLLGVQRGVKNLDGFRWPGYMSTKSIFPASAVLQEVCRR